MDNKILIVGAGVAGLSAGRTLKDLGRAVLLVDKGRGLGGRVATRRLGERDHLQGRWDHGAQFATFRSRAMIQQLRAWGCWDLMQPWIPAYPKPEKEAEKEPELFRLRPLEGMNALPKALAGDLDIHRGQRISRLEKLQDGWRAHAESGEVFEASGLICTLPVPQFLDLLRASGLELTGAESAQLDSVRYARCLTLLAELDGPSGLDDNGYVRPRSGILESMIDQHQKSISPSHTLVANATAAFSLEWYDRDRPTAASVMRAAVQEKISSKINAVQIHGWKFAKATVRVPRNFLRLENGIVLAGDGFAAGDESAPAKLHPRIESAMLSGLAAAKEF